MSGTLIPVPDGEVWAEDTGGDLPPLVLLHPGIGDSAVWEPIMPALRAEHRVIRYDARGYGRSPAPGKPFSMLDDLVAVLDHFGVSRTPIVGSSQGGMAAIGLALADPGRVTALVLLCPGISGYPQTPDPALEQEFEAAAAQGPDAVAEIGLRLWAAAGRTPDAVAQMRGAARAWIANDGLEREDPPVRDRLGEIAVPTGLLVGEADRDWLLASNREAGERIPGCEYVEVPGLDHLPPLREPERVLALIRSTLARVPS
jgi:3-oxoadipate enol-lactonase